jgi:hypothetical protein
MPMKSKPSLNLTGVVRRGAVPVVPAHKVGWALAGDGACGRQMQAGRVRRDTQATRRDAHMLGRQRAWREQLRERAGAQPHSRQHAPRAVFVVDRRAAEHLAALLRRGVRACCTATAAARHSACAGGARGSAKSGGLQRWGSWCSTVAYCIVSPGSSCSAGLQSSWSCLGSRHAACLRLAFPTKASHTCTRAPHLLRP